MASVYEVLGELGEFGVPTMNGRVVFAYRSVRSADAGVTIRVRVVWVLFKDAERVAPA
jgi:hypothetical protein